MPELTLIINDIRSVHNVGSIFRTADGAGVSKIFLTGFSPGPVDRFNRKVSAFTKVSLGAEDTISWERAEDALSLLEKLKESGVYTIALEQDSRSVSFEKIEKKERMALVIGNEVGGVPRKILDVVDAIGEIPMRGKKESLNVSVATGIALYDLTKSK